VGCDLLDAAGRGARGGFEVGDQFEQVGLAAAAEGGEGDAEQTAVSRPVADRAERAKGEKVGADADLDRRLNAKIGEVGEPKETAVDTDVEKSPAKRIARPETTEGDVAAISEAPGTAVLGGPALRVHLNLNAHTWPSSLALCAAAENQYLGDVISPAKKV